MRWLTAVVCLLPLVWGNDLYFICNDQELSVESNSGLSTPKPLNNQLAHKFMLTVHKDNSYYSPNETIRVTLSARYPEININQFLMVARSPCDQCKILPPLGSFSAAVSEHAARVDRCASSAENSMIFETDKSHKRAVNVLWIAPDSQATIEFVAAVVASDNNSYHQISSTFLTPYSLSPAGQEKPYDSELEEEEEEEGYDEEKYAEEESGPERPEEEEEDHEDPREQEDWEEEQREESLRRDGYGDDDNGAKREEEMKIMEEERRRQEVRLEDEASEAGWVQEKYDEIREQEEEYLEELRQYEEMIAEEERRRVEMMKWEIRDKEEYDARVAEEERERDSNRTPNKDNTYSEEIDINDIKHTDELMSNNVSAATNMAASVAVVTMAAILKFFF